MPTESSSESDVSDMHHEKAARKVTPHRRKYAKKTSNKKTSKKATKRKHITWEPLYFDGDDTGKNDE